MGFTRVLGLFNHRLKQPQVVMEVIGGILLGPSALGQNTHFSLSIFPPSSIKYIDLVATVGLILYLFVIGLELDPRLLFKNSKVYEMRRLFCECC
jgi:Kef-type K+ transport system membrane component KefB